LSPSISCSAALDAIRRGERLPHRLIRALGEEHPAEFFRLIIEPLADSFDAAQAAAYDELMQAWIRPAAKVDPVIPARVDTVFVLSRVTLGADIKITSIILDAMKRRFPDAQIVFVANRKSAELFTSDPQVRHLEANYPRSGPVSDRIVFATTLWRQLDTPNRIVIDPDSRMTQLGLIPVCEPEHYFHFPSRISDSSDNLTELTRSWLLGTFGQTGDAYIAPETVAIDVAIDNDAPRAAISLGIGENESKRIPGDFEASLIRRLGARFKTLWIDRGAGGEEALRVTAAVEASGVAAQVRFWEGSFAGFASIIRQSNYYAGYDSAGQHAAAACGTPLISYFAGAPSERFRQRWAPFGHGSIEVVDA
jgi:ADP-heptose:LPS heptosyltransferase